MRTRRNKAKLVDKILFRENKLLRENQITYFDKFYGPATLQPQTHFPLFLKTESNPQKQAEAANTENQGKAEGKSQKAIVKKEESNLGVSSYHTEDSKDFRDSFDEDFGAEENEADSHKSLANSSQRKRRKFRKKGGSRLGKRSKMSGSAKGQSVTTIQKNRKDRYFKKGFDIMALNYDIFYLNEKKEQKKKAIKKKKQAYEPVRGK